MYAKCAITAHMMDAAGMPWLCEASAHSLQTQRPLPFAVIFPAHFVPRDLHITPESTGNLVTAPTSTALY